MAIIRNIFKQSPPNLPQYQIQEKNKMKLLIYLLSMRAGI